VRGSLISKTAIRCSLARLRLNRNHTKMMRREIRDTEAHRIRSTTRGNSFFRCSKENAQPRERQIAPPCLCVSVFSAQNSSSPSSLRAFASNLLRAGHQQHFASKAHGRERPLSPPAQWGVAVFFGTVIPHAGVPPVPGAIYAEKHNARPRRPCHNGAQRT
jgi:hypothetical protein